MDVLASKIVESSARMDSQLTRKSALVYADLDIPAVSSPLNRIHSHFSGGTVSNFE